jgi:hypothetical protein
MALYTANIMNCLTQNGSTSSVEDLPVQKEHQAGDGEEGSKEDADCSRRNNVLGL